MPNCVHFSILCAFCLVIISQPFPVTEDIRAALYLQKCGYLEDRPDNRSQSSGVAISNALKDFQRFLGLNQTGVLDNETKVMMNKPRCGDKNRIGHSNTIRKQVYAYLGIYVFDVAASEFGQSLDLAHTEEKNDIMTNQGNEYAPMVKIFVNDMKTNQALRGLKEGLVITPERETLRPATNDPPDACKNGSIDTATRTQNGYSYFFKGDFYWRVLDNKRAAGYPRKITNDWTGLEGNLDASFTWSNGQTFFFKGSWYWKFINKEMEPGYPRLISQGFEGIPDNLDAAFVSGKDGKTYFFKGDKYWRYDSNNDPPVSSEFPLPISEWAGLPNNIDAAFQFENTKTYFFKGDRFYRIYDEAFKVDIENPPYPRSTSVWWFFC